MALVERFMGAWQPTHLWYNGDFLDAHQVSKFCRDPRNAQGLWDDLKEAETTFRRHREILPDAEIAFNKGNHEVRIETYIAQRAPAFADFPVLELEALMGLEEIGATVREYRERAEVLPGLEIVHGAVARARSGASALAEMKGYSGVSGHTHRLGMAWQRDKRSVERWVEGGCLCSVEPGAFDYTDVPDWQQGFTIMYVDRECGRYELRPVEIRKDGGRKYLYFEGRIIEVKAET